MSDLHDVLVEAGMEPLDAQTIAASHDSGASVPHEAQDFVQGAMRSWWANEGVRQEFKRLLGALNEAAPKTQEWGPEDIIKGWDTQLDYIKNNGLLGTVLARHALQRQMETIEIESTPNESVIFNFTTDATLIRSYESAAKSVQYEQALLPLIAQLAGLYMDSLLEDVFLAGLGA